MATTVNRHNQNFVHEFSTGRIQSLLSLEAIIAAKYVSTILGKHRWGVDICVTMGTESGEICLVRQQTRCPCQRPLCNFPGDLHYET